MATDTCKSIITYANIDDRQIEPFATQKEIFAEQLVNQGKASDFPNLSYENGVGLPGQRNWVDHAAAQEFIDWVVLNAPTYNVNITSTAIVDL